MTSGLGCATFLTLTCQALLAAMLKVFASALLAYSRAEMYSRACCHHVCTLYMKVSRRGCDTQELMAAGPDAVHAVVERILAESHASGNAAGSSVPMTHDALGDAEGGLQQSSTTWGQSGSRCCNCSSHRYPSICIKSGCIMCGAFFAGPSLSVETHLKANFMSHVIIIAK